MAEGMEGHSLVGWDGIGRHRRVSVSKAENGFIMKAKVTRIIEDPLDGIKRRRDAEEVYVFYTVTELLHSLKTYLEAPPDELQKE